MGQPMLLRDVPENLRHWIDSQRQDRLMSQREFVLGVLNQAYKEGRELTLFDQVSGAPVPPLGTNKVFQAPFTFIDLFAGIGGMRLALQRVGGRCIFSSEWDKYAQKT